MKNYLLIWDRFGDYHFARLKKLQELVLKEKGMVYGISASTFDELYKWKNQEYDNHSYLGSNQIKVFDVLRLHQIFRAIRRNRIDVVCLPALSRPLYIFTILLCLILRVQTIVFYESWYKSSFLKTVFKRIYLSVPTKIFASGQLAKNYLLQIGVKGNKVIEGYSVVDSDFFSRDISVEKEKCLLCVARISKEKNLQFLIDTFINHRISEEYKLILVGEGPLKLRIPEKCQSIELMTWQSSNVLKTLYNRASYSILPSSFEPWGLVVNESLHCGTPVILSNAVGCIPEFGFKDLIFSPEHKESLQQCFSFVLSKSVSETEKIAQEQSLSLSQYTTTAWALNIIKAL